MQFLLLRKTHLEILPLELTSLESDIINSISHTFFCAGLHYWRRAVVVYALTNVIYHIQAAIPFPVTHKQIQKHKYFEACALKTCMLGLSPTQHGTSWKELIKAPAQPSPYAWLVFRWSIVSHNRNFIKQSKQVWYIKLPFLLLAWLEENPHQGLSTVETVVRHRLQSQSRAALFLSRSRPEKQKT